MNAATVASAREQLAQKALELYQRRRQPREAKQQEINAHGILEAAGPMAVVRRAAHLTVAEGRTFEATIGKNDSDQFNFLERGRRAGHTVCRLVSERTPVGSGFLVAPGLVLTNNHVIPDQAEAETFVAEFNFELDADDVPLRPAQFQLDTSVFVTSDRNLLDFTLVAVRPRSDTGADVRSFGWLPLDPRPDKILEGEPVVIIQHPDGRLKELCLFDSELVDRVDDFVQYTTDTFFGSSGSPAFNRQWQLIALHHASVETGEHRRGLPVVVNQGVRVSRIVEALRTEERVTGNVREAFQIISDPQVQGGGRPMVPDTEPRPPATPSDTGFEARGTSVQPRPASHFRGRRGYSPTFLGTGPLRVDLPKMPAWMEEDTVRLISDPDDYLLKYQHFSIVMSASRGLAIYTAVNIDGRTLDDSVGRKDRDPDNPRPTPPRSGNVRHESLVFEAAADKWFFDGRIDTAVQLHPELLDATEFVFGHLVRRQDPVWGDERTKRIANDDTFYMTNCSPQHDRFNGAARWEKLENAIQDAADENDVKITVFTGPVLDPRDPEIMGVKCPLAFWKVIAYKSGGTLKSRAFLKWQTDLVDEIRRSFEGLSQLDRVEQDQVSVREIAQLTSLDFGPLFAADEMQGQPHHRIDERTVAAIVHELGG